MADIYVKSGATGLANGSSWVNAFTTLAAAAAVDVAGDRIFVSHQHTETTNLAVTLDFAGTDAAPITVACVDDSSIPPVSVSNTALVATGAGTYSITISGVIFMQGIRFSAGSGGTMAHINLGTDSSNQRYKGCRFDLLNSNTGSGIAIGMANATGCQRTVMEDCSFNFGRADLQRIGVSSRVRITGGSIGYLGPLYTGQPLNILAGSGEGAGNFEADGIDFSALGTNFSVFPVFASNGSNGRAIIRNAKMPAGWTGELVSPRSNLVQRGRIFELYNGSAAHVKYGLWIEKADGAIKSDINVWRIGGANDGGGYLSWKMSTESSAIFPVYPLSSPEISIWNPTFGAAKTLTVEIAHDSQGAGAGGAFQDDEIWVEVQYIGASGHGTFISDCKADVLATAADQTSSSASWNTPGMTAPVTQKLSVTFTPQERGYLQAKVVMAKASKTCYVCPKVVVS